MLCPVALTWSAMAEVLSFLARALKCSVFLSWSRRLVLPVSSNPCSKNQNIYTKVFANSCLLKMNKKLISWRLTSTLYPCAPLRGRGRGEGGGLRGQAHDPQFLLSRDVLKNRPVNRDSSAFCETRTAKILDRESWIEETKSLICTETTITGLWWLDLTFL